jgi:hypothetical protein
MQLQLGALKQRVGLQIVRAQSQAPIGLRGFRSAAAVQMAPNMGINASQQYNGLPPNRAAAAEHVGSGKEVRAKALKGKAGKAQQRAGANSPSDLAIRQQYLLQRRAERIESIRDRLMRASEATSSYSSSASVANAAQAGQGAAEGEGEGGRSFQQWVRPGVTPGQPTEPSMSSLRGDADSAKLGDNADLVIPPTRSHCDETTGICEPIDAATEAEAEELSERAYAAEHPQQSKQPQHSQMNEPLSASSAPRGSAAAGKKARSAKRVARGNQQQQQQGAQAEQRAQEAEGAVHRSPVSIIDDAQHQREQFSKRLSGAVLGGGFIDDGETAGAAGGTGARRRAGAHQHPEARDWLARHPDFEKYGTRPSSYDAHGYDSSHAHPREASARFGGAEHGPRLIDREGTDRGFVAQADAHTGKEHHPQHAGSWPNSAANAAPPLREKASMLVHAAKEKLVAIEEKLEQKVEKGAEALKQEWETAGEMEESAFQKLHGLTMTQAAAARVGDVAGNVAASAKAAAPAVAEKAKSMAGAAAARLQDAAPSIRENVAEAAQTTAAATQHMAKKVGAAVGEQVERVVGQSETGEKVLEGSRTAARALKEAGSAAKEGARSSIATHDPDLGRTRDYLLGAASATTSALMNIGMAANLGADVVWQAMKRGTLSLAGQAQAQAQGRGSSPGHSAGQSEGQQYTSPTETRTSPPSTRFNPLEGSTSGAGPARSGPADGLTFEPVDRSAPLSGHEREEGEVRTVFVKQEDGSLKPQSAHQQRQKHHTAASAGAGAAAGLHIPPSASATSEGSEHASKSHLPHLQTPAERWASHVIEDTETQGQHYPPSAASSSGAAGGASRSYSTVASARPFSRPFTTSGQ